MMRFFCFLFAILAADPASAAPTFKARIDALVAGSACATYSWKDRGTAPLGYSQGLALSFGRALCKNTARLTAAETGDTAHDAVAYYRTQFTALHIRTDVAGTEPLRALYTLAYGEGMRESSGNYCTGWDKSAGSNRPADEAEAGIFQSSYDSISAAAELSTIYADYVKHPERCLLSDYQPGASCVNQSVMGRGPAAKFQSFTKGCPAFGTDYAVVLFRTLRAHFGPINRKEAEVVSSCERLLYEVQSLVQANSAAACAELN